tara:strand:+ start:193 stop:375 length:183 start_codon:yes stop_codon:yes gene_type:complete
MKNKEIEVKDRIDAYVDETWRCWIDQEASMKKHGLRSMFEQILEDGKQLAKIEREGKDES